MLSVIRLMKRLEIGAKAVDDSREIMLITTEGIIIRLEVSGISKLGRITSGVKLINMDVENDVTVASIAKVREGSNSSDEELIKELENEAEL